MQATHQERLGALACWNCSPSTLPRQRRSCSLWTISIRILLPPISEVFPPEEAKALADKLEIHYTPKHASWLNIAEIELSVLVRQGLAHNIATMQEFCAQAEQWQTARNQSGTTVRWQFTTADARIKLERLYPLYKKPSGMAP